MKIGIFDSGVGGLIITHSIIGHLPQYDYVYLGDIARVPYGNRSQAEIYQFTIEALSYLFARGCSLVIIACNTASAEALRKIQQNYMPQYFPDRHVLGVLIPAAEEAVVTTKNERVGVIATQSTVESQAFIREITKLNSKISVFQQAAPLLVPFVESGELSRLDGVLDEYLAPLLRQGIDTLILGCTHYPYLKQEMSNKVGLEVRIISQDEIVPLKLSDYLSRHTEIEEKLSQNSQRTFLVTDVTNQTQALSDKLFNEPLVLQRITLP